MKRLLCVLTFGIAGVIHAPALALPTFNDVKAAYRPSDAILLDRRGVPIQTVRVDRAVRRLPWVPLQDMSPALLRALVLSEDRNFYEHAGVDWGALAKSAWSNAWNTRTRGASTLTMQFAGLLDDDLARPEGGRSITQKLQQVSRARELEKQWQKSEILESYLNLVPFRGEIVGINALAQTMFEKHPTGLDWDEAAIAAALVRGPNADAATVAHRACGILKLQSLGCDGIAARAGIAFSRPGTMPLGEQLAPHFARQVIRPGATTGPRVIRTTLDARVQRVAIAALRSQLTELRGRHVEDGAVVVLDNANGEVLAWVGSSGVLSDAAEVDGVLARRQPGSTLKPFVYELAFEQRFITPATLLDDSPAQLGTTSGLYVPQNYDRHFKGWVSARTALGASLNVPAVRVGAMLGADALFARLNAFGLALPESGGYYGASLALGSADVTLLALTNAYRALANGGVYREVNLDGRPAAATRVADAKAVFLTADILADNAARARTFGLANALATRGFAAVKTGTSKDMRDNWCIGFTDRYTIGVWVGNASGEAMHDVSGVSGAAPVWQAVVDHLHANSPSRPPVAPSGVVRAHAEFDRGLEPPRPEIFIAGTQASRKGSESQRLRASPFGIASPVDGSLFAIDPDMPPASQKITFEGEHGTWVLDGKRLGTGRLLRWSPWPGRHELTLLGANGKAIQSVRFEVRGAGVKIAKAPG
ncbi:MAG: penicillin-binding protein 1C [Casimicrobiaceae bacterium]